MAKDLNKCMFIGRLGRDVEVKYAANGNAIATISLGCGWKTKDNEGTEWVRVKMFGRLAEIASEYLLKGSQVFIEGRWSTNKWQDQNGQDRYTTEIVANDMQMLGGRGEATKGGTSSHQAGQGGAPSSQAAPDSFDDFDDIPF